MSQLVPSTNEYVECLGPQQVVRSIQLHCSSQHRLGYKSLNYWWWDPSGERTHITQHCSQSRI